MLPRLLGVDDSIEPGLLRFGRPIALRANPSAADRHRDRDQQGICFHRWVMVEIEFPDISTAFTELTVEVAAAIEYVSQVEGVLLYALLTGMALFLIVYTITHPSTPDHPTDEPTEMSDITICEK